MSNPSTSNGAGRRSWLMALPLIAFAALAAIFWFRLGSGDPSRIPSALIGRPAPQTALPALDGLAGNGVQIPGLDPAVFKGKVSIVNVWASWCVPCHDEAPLLVTLGQDKRLQLVGINYKDAPDNARRFLGRYGNPFGIVGVDGNGPIRSASSASTATAAPRSNGASTACRKLLSSAATAPSPTRWWARSHRRISTAF